ncbi:hypothetical protein GCM10009792_21840 [Microcella alkalica]
MHRIVEPEPRGVGSMVEPLGRCALFSAKSVSLVEKKDARLWAISEPDAVLDERRPARERTPMQRGMLLSGRDLGDAVQTAARAHQDAGSNRGGEGARGDARDEEVATTGESAVRTDEVCDEHPRTVAHDRESGFWTAAIRGIRVATSRSGTSAGQLRRLADADTRHAAFQITNSERANDGAGGRTGGGGTPVRTEPGSWRGWRGPARGRARGVGAPSWRAESGPARGRGVRNWRAG